MTPIPYHPAMPRVAFLSMDDLTGFVSDDALCLPHLAAHGIDVEEVPWRRPAAQARWDSFDLVVIRTPWDYQRDVHAFLRVLTEIGAATRLENPLPLVRWNVRKTYLRDLERAGLGIVPTAWFPRGLDVPLTECAAEQGWSDEVVIKPIVSANADLTYRVASDVPPPQRAELERRFANLPCMVQPFVASVPTRGEVSIVLFDGEVSHALRKTPKAGDFRVQEEHGGLIEGETVEPWMRSLGERVAPVLVTAMSSGGGEVGGGDVAGASVPSASESRPLLARIDVVTGPKDEPWIMEVEAIEPSIYLRTDPGAPARFAAAVAARVRRG